MRPPYSCAVPGKKPGTSTSVTIGIAEGVAEAHEARPLARGVGVEHAGEHHRLLRHDADRAALDAAKPVTMFLA